MSYTMDQIARSGTSFNPFSPEGQGEAFTGENVNRLFAALAEFKWNDPRFVSANEVEAAGLVVRQDAHEVKVFIRDDSPSQWAEKIVYNASEVSGIPTLEKMLAEARKRLTPEAELSITPAPGQTNTHTVVPVDTSADLDPDLIVGRSEVGNPPPLVSDELSVIPVLKTSGDDKVIDGRPTPEYVAFSLPNKMFKERVPSSGQYFRNNAKTPAFIDKGESVIVHDKKTDAYQAVMALAKVKGWESIQLAGKPEHVARGWLEAQLLGIEVINFTPTEQDLVKLEQAREEKLRVPGEHHIENAKVVSVGRHVGTIVDIRDGYAIQNGGRNQFLAHALTQFDTKPEVGEKVDIQYHCGKPQMRNTLSKAQENSVAR
ncbi:LPD7 domain-containing protein [Glaciimonas sp. GG7]